MVSLAQSTQLLLTAHSQPFSDHTAYTKCSSNGGPTWIISTLGYNQGSAHFRPTPEPDGASISFTLVNNMCSAIATCQATSGETKARFDGNDWYTRISQKYAQPNDAAWFKFGIVDKVGKLDVGHSYTCWEMTARTL